VIAAADRRSGPVLAGTGSDVSRETDRTFDVDGVQPDGTGLSDAARAYLGPSLEPLVAYALLLSGRGIERGLIGPREVPRLWQRHLLNCAVVADLIPADAQVDDVGSGAGLPGIVLAVVRPDLRVTLVEPLLRRTTFLEEVVAELGLSNVRVVRARAEERAAAVSAGESAPADVVTARAVAPLSRLVGWCLPLLREGGQLLALKGSSARTELADAGSSVARAGGALAELLTVGGGIVDPPTTVIRVTRTTRTPPARKTRRGAR